MSETIAFVYAHPDDETFLSAALIRRLVDEGHRAVLLLATRGDAGGRNGEAAHLSRGELGALREREMEQAAGLLGIAETAHLGYPDGGLKEVDEAEFLERAVEFLNAHRPAVVVTFPPDGGNGHPDHIAISRVTTEAVLSGRCPSVHELYYGGPRGEGEPLPEGAIRIDTAPAPVWAVKAEALRAHRSQLLAIERFFGDLSACPPNRRYEVFTPAWRADAAGLLGGDA